MRQDGVGPAAVSDFGSLCTRSHSRAGPEWTVQDMLILVNEISAVEGDCQNALSSYQKWGIIAENCTGLGVARNLNQCRRKWESLLSEYKLVNEWEANSGDDSYWCIGCERRKEAGVPVDFDKELYKAINNFLKTQERADTDPENDPEAADIDAFDDVESDPKPKKVRRRSTCQKGIMKRRKKLMADEDYEKPEPVGEKMEQVSAGKRMDNVELILGSKSKRVRNQSIPLTGSIKEMQQPVSKEKQEKPDTGVLAVIFKENTEPIYNPEMKWVRHHSTPQNGTIEREQPMSEEEPEGPSPAQQMEQILAEKLKENTELIHAILAGNFPLTLDPGLTYLKDEEILKTEMVRCKAEKLIACLGDLTKNLEQIHNVIEES